ncbi:MAG: CPBP family intramembrane metalloprotease [Promethearchaeota archaeon]|nr:MAG: CPBP family intramembrane metalloprotease [Candidatus Lokiarchaeota archaeon]
MKLNRKYGILGILCVVLIIPILFGTYVEYLFIRELNFIVFITLIFGLIAFILMDILIVDYGYNDTSFEALKSQDVIKALITGENKEIIWIFLPMIMLIEELIFRYYLMGFLLKQVELEVIWAILISSAIFSLFHIHIWFRFKNLRVLIINLIDSFFLGLFNAYIFLTLGLIPCIFIHYGLVLLLYYGIYKKFFKSIDEST